MYLFKLHSPSFFVSYNSKIRNVEDFYHSLEIRVTEIRLKIFFSDFINSILYYLFIRKINFLIQMEINELLTERVSKSKKSLLFPIHL